MIFKSASPQGDLNGFLDAGGHIQGELRFEDTFRLEGKLTGSVVSGGDLVVGEAGEVDGEVRVHRVFVSGTVRGTLKAASRVEILATGKVMADIETPTLCIEEGAFFEGRCAMESSRSTDAQKTRPKVAQMAIAKERA